MIKVLLVPAHHQTTKGKQSPDGKLKEFSYSREIISMIIKELEKKGCDVENPIPETEEELSLKEQCNIINNIYDKCNGDCIVVTCHVNASGNGSQWMNGSGWSCYIYKNAGQKTKELAKYITESAKEEGLKIRYEYPNIPYWTSNFYICKHTKPSTVLTENLFQDNKEDVEFLLSEEGKQKIVDLHVNGILKYLMNNCKANE